MKNADPMTHLSSEELFRFRVGSLEDGDLERMAAHLEECQHCQEGLAGQTTADPLLARLREPLLSESHADEPECAQTIESLEETLTLRLGSKETGVATQEWLSGAALQATASVDALATAGRRPRAEPPFAQLPCEFGRYRVLKRLGSGGMGAVYLAHDTLLDREVALKVPQPQPSVGSPEAERFLREARSAARLAHEGICQVLDAGAQDGALYLTMAYIRGESLARVLDAGPLEPERAAGIIHRVAGAMDYAHRQGVLHRDIKPGNIMLDQEGRPRIVDFGLARRAEDAYLTRSGVAAGTLAYMNPEQLDGVPANASSDVYSLGVTLYQLITGRLPYSTASLSQLVAQINEGTPPRPTALRPGLDSHLEAICLKAMARAQAERYPSMAEFAAALELYLSGRGTGGYSGPTGETPVLRGRRLTGETPVPRGRRLWPWVAAAAVLLLAPVGYLVLQQLRPPVAGEQPVLAPVPKVAPFVVLALKPQLDVRIWKKDDVRTARRLADLGALPLQAGDLMRIEARVDREAYLYVIYLDAKGASPMFPWRHYDWNDRPAEHKLRELNLPEDASKAAPLDAGPSGIEAVLLLARNEPISDDEARRLRQLLDNAPAEGKFDPLRGAVWLGGEDRFLLDVDRGRPNLNQTGAVVDPVERLRRLVRGDLKKLADDVRGVCYPFQGQ